MAIMLSALVCVTTCGLVVTVSGFFPRRCSIPACCLLSCCTLACVVALSEVGLHMPRYSSVRSSPLLRIFNSLLWLCRREGLPPMVVRGWEGQEMAKSLWVWCQLSRQLGRGMDLFLSLHVHVCRSWRETSRVLAPSAVIASALGKSHVPIIDWCAASEDLCVSLGSSIFGLPRAKRCSRASSRDRCWPASTSAAFTRRGLPTCACGRWRWEPRLSLGRSGRSAPDLVLPPRHRFALRTWEPRPPQQPMRAGARGASTSSTARQGEMARLVGPAQRRR